jgi:hypothetical protein
LERLVELDATPEFCIAANEPDPRGWSIVSAEGQSVGIVRTLLIDTDRLKARYFVGELLGDVRAVLLPVPLARLDLQKHRVIYDVSPATAFASLPRYIGSSPTEHDRDQIQRMLAATETVPPNHAASAERRQRERRSSSAE